MTTAIYIRVSTKDKGQDTKMQETACRNYCSLRELTDIEIFEDVKSGKRTNRPKYQKMFALILTGKIKHVVAYKLDRLSRSSQDLLNLATICKGAGCYLSIATQAIDTSSAMGNFIFQVMGAFAEFESALISERVKDGMAEKASRGAKFGGDRKSVQYNSERISPYLFRDRPWALRKIREKLKMQRNLFYKTIEWMEKESGGFITDYSDERYDAIARAFTYKRVSKDGKYRNTQDPRLLLQEAKKCNLALREVGEFFGYYKDDDTLAYFVNHALDGASVARDLPSVDDLF